MRTAQMQSKQQWSGVPRRGEAQLNSIVAGCRVHILVVLAQWIDTPEKHTVLTLRDQPAASAAHHLARGCQHTAALTCQPLPSAAVADALTAPGAQLAGAARRACSPASHKADTAGQNAGASRG